MYSVAFEEQAYRAAPVSNHKDDNRLLLKTYQQHFSNHPLAATARRKSSP